MLLPPKIMNFDDVFLTKVINFYVITSVDV